MLRLHGNEDIFISEDLNGYALQLVREGTIPRQVDLLLLGFSYAVQNGIQPAEHFKRHVIMRTVYSIEDVRLPVEAVAHWYAREIGWDELSDTKALLNFICGVGIAGARALKERWQEKSKSQIQWDIMQLAADPTTRIR